MHFLLRKISMTTSKNISLPSHFHFDASMVHMNISIHPGIKRRSGTDSCRPRLRIICKFHWVRNRDKPFSKTLFTTSASCSQHQDDLCIENRILMAKHENQRRSLIPTFRAMDLFLPTVWRVALDTIQIIYMTILLDLK